MYAPCGLDIGAATVEETAIAVLAEMTAHRAHRSGASLRDSSGPIRRRKPGAPELATPMPGDRAPRARGRWPSSPQAVGDGLGAYPRIEGCERVARPRCWAAASAGATMQRRELAVTGSSLHRRPHRARSMQHKTITRRARVSIDAPSDPSLPAIRADDTLSSPLTRSPWRHLARVSCTDSPAGERATPGATQNTGRLGVGAPHVLQGAARSRPPWRARGRSPAAAA